MKAEELKTKTIDELNKILLDVRKDQMNLRFELANGQLDKSHKIREARRTVARIKTIITQKTNEAKAA
tara:strand:- start:16073 stop:16276 length:204 start_codon:yes stop_codon:yes gene_type:complete